MERMRLAVEESPAQGPDFMNGLVDFFNFYTSKGTNDNVRIHFFDQLEFINAKLYFDSPHMVPEDFAAHRLIHANGLTNLEKSLAEKKLWFLDEQGSCVKDLVVPSDKM
jgi:hypothetical protein